MLWLIVVGMGKLELSRNSYLMCLVWEAYLAFSVSSWFGRGVGGNNRDKLHWPTYDYLALIAAEVMVLLRGLVAGEVVVRVILSHIILTLSICTLSFSWPINICWMSKWIFHLSKYCIHPFLFYLSHQVLMSQLLSLSKITCSLLNIWKWQLPHSSRSANFKRKHISLPREISQAFTLNHYAIPPSSDETETCVPWFSTAYFYYIFSLACLPYLHYVSGMKNILGCNSGLTKFFLYRQGGWPSKLTFPT